MLFAPEYAAQDKQKHHAAEFTRGQEDVICQ